MPHYPYTKLVSAVDVVVAIQGPYIRVLRAFVCFRIVVLLPSHIAIRAVPERSNIPRCQICYLLRHITLFPALRWTTAEENW